MRRVILWSLALGLLTACESQTLERMDRELTGLIKERQREALGDQGIEPKPNVPMSTTTHATARAYDQQPGTANPASRDLPAMIPSTQPALGPKLLGELRGGAPISSPLLTAATQPSTQPASKASTIEDPEEAAEFAIPLDLESALAYGTAHSRDYRNQKENLYVAAINLLTEQHLWGPQFFSTMSANFTGTPEAGDKDQALELINETGVTQRLPYGGTVSASALVSYVNMLHSASTSGDGNVQTSALLLSANIPLLRGAGLAARESLIQQERNLYYATRRFEQYRRTFFVDVATRFYDLIQARSAMRNRRVQLANLEWLAKRTEAMARAGRVPFFEVQRAEQQVLFALNDLLAARERYALQRDSFKIFIGLPVESKFRLLPSAIDLPVPEVDQAAAVRAALKLRLDLQTASDQVDDARRQVEIARNNQLPDVNLNANVNLPSDPALKYGGGKLNAGSGSYFAGLSVDLPLDRRAEELGLRKSLIQLEQARRSYDLQQDQVAQDVRKSIRQILAAQRSLELQKRNIDLAQKRKRGVALRLRELGPRDFIEAERDLLDAQDRADQAQRDLRVTILQYLRDSGQLRVTSDGKLLPPGRAQPLDIPFEDVGSDIPRLLKEAENLNSGNGAERRGGDTINHPPMIPARP